MGFRVFPPPSSLHSIRGQLLSPTTQMPTTQLAVRYLPAIGAAAVNHSRQTCGVLQIACRVKPGVASSREGILSVTDQVIELCVSAKPKDGEANKAVTELIACVCYLLPVSNYRYLYMTDRK